MTLISYSQVWCLDPLPLGRALFSRALPAGPRRYLCASQKLNLPSAGLNQAKAFLKNSTLLYFMSILLYFMHVLCLFYSLLLHSCLFFPRASPGLQAQLAPLSIPCFRWNQKKLTLSHCFGLALRCLSHASDGKNSPFLTVLAWSRRGHPRASRGPISTSHP